MCGDRREECSGVTVETEVTPEMLQAGVDAYMECDRVDDPWEQIVSQVYSAMASARSRKREEFSSPQ
jgi:hypothetical protein